MEKQFDQAFLELLKSGSRHEQANYRNCIIEEERRRLSHTDFHSLKDMYVSTTKEAKSCRKIALFFAAPSALFVVACVCFIPITIGRGLFFLTIVLGLSLVINGMNTLKFLRMFGFYNYIYQEFKNQRVAIVSVQSSSDISSPDIFRVIANDTEDILKNKKAKLDEILGL